MFRWLPLPLATTTVPATYTQQSYRFRDDNGSETTANWLASANINTSRKVAQVFRLRFLIQQATSTASSGLVKNFKLKYSLNSGAYTDIGTQGSTSHPIRFVASSNVTDEGATTQQVGVGTFVAGKIFETPGSTSNITFSTGALSETEIEFVLEIYNSLKSTDTLSLRVYESNDTVLTTYTNTPIIYRINRKFIIR